MSGIRLTHMPLEMSGDLANCDPFYLPDGVKPFGGDNQSHRFEKQKRIMIDLALVHLPSHR